MSPYRNTFTEPFDDEPLDLGPLGPELGVEGLGIEGPRTVEPQHRRVETPAHRSGGEERIAYFDYAATTPVDPRVKEAMLPYFSEIFGNAASLHRVGQEALKAVDQSRETIKKIIGAQRLSEVIFTSSATESNNLAIKGTTYRHIDISKSRHTPHIITSLIEHPSVLETFRDLEKQELAETTYVPPDKHGIIQPAAVKAALREETILISIHHVNSEIGVIQPIQEIVQEVRNREASFRVDPRVNPRQSASSRVVFHSDAAQSFLTEPCNVENLGVDLLTLSSHKIYGPKGVALLYVRGDTKLQPLFSGGTGTGQHYLRPSTENTPGIVGFAKAMELAEKERQANRAHLKAMRNYLAQRLVKEIPGTEINACPTFERSQCRHSEMSHLSPKIINVYFPHTTAQHLLISLDLQGIAISPGTACTARAAKPSQIILTLRTPSTDSTDSLQASSGQAKKIAERSIRISLGKETTKEEIDKLIKALKEVSKREQHDQRSL